jgi:glycosyltransferase involved in cell wall biosynthesis
MSVLIPARNEEGSIVACVESVRDSIGVELEVVVLDDHSEDQTADVVREIAAKDPRVRLESAPPLPVGWCGKQHACHTLSKLARLPILCFLDADVRLSPDALARMAAFLRLSKAGLLSGFPRQETGTLLEKLVIPIINWLLVGFLPMVGMRLTRHPGFGVGCGQWFMTTRTAYDAVGGHNAVKGSMHDGLTLPRAYRRAGFHTDICDATELAACRMYRSASGVWNGLAKNAREGMASNTQILLWTYLLFVGQVLPFLLLLNWPAQLLHHDWMRYNSPGVQTDAAIQRDYIAVIVAQVGCVLAYAPRIAATIRFRASWLGAALHPVGVLVLVGIQWYAVYRAVIGKPVGWKGRSRPAVT